MVIGILLSKETRPGRDTAECARNEGDFNTVLDAPTELGRDDDLVAQRRQSQGTCVHCGGFPVLLVIG
jgi:hypothetical protein